MTGKRARSVTECARIWANTLIEHERRLRLLAILYTSLENNSSLERLTQFKRTAKAELQTLSEPLGGAFPTLAPERADEFLHVQAALAIGLYPMSHLSDVQRQAMEQAGFDHIGFGLEARLRDTIDHVLRGWTG